MFGAELAHVVEQLLFMLFGDQTNRVLRVAGFAAGVNEGAAAKAFRVEPGLEHGKQVKEPVGRGRGFVDFSPEPEHPAHIAALQGRDGELLLVGEVAVDTLSGDAGSFHQEIHAGGCDATFVDQLFGDVQNDVACVVASDFVHATNSRTIVLLGQAGICIAHEIAIASKLAPTFKMHSPCGSELACVNDTTDTEKTQTHTWCKLSGSSDSTFLRALCRRFSNALCCPNCAVFR